MSARSLSVLTFAFAIFLAIGSERADAQGFKPRPTKPAAGSKTAPGKTDKDKPAAATSKKPTRSGRHVVTSKPAPKKKKDQAKKADDDDDDVVIVDDDD